MEKRISFDQFQSIKRVAQACNPLMMKREKIKKQINALASVYKDYDAQISALEAGIKQVTGFRVEELVQKVMESGVDANGQPKKTTKYLPTSIISYDETKKQYVISIPDSGEHAVQQAVEHIAETAEETSEGISEENNGETTSEESTVIPEAFPADEVPTDAPIFE